MSRTLYCPACLTTFTDDTLRCPNLSCGAPRPGLGWPSLLAVGDRLDRHYRILRILALAGGGVTYQARELDADDRDVPPDLAIKVLYAHRDTGEQVRRLANEAQVLQQLAHEHIVESRGFVHRRGAPPYLVTTFERGGTLAEHVHRVGTLSPRVAGRVLRQLALALEIAHARGVVHRDLKPQNVLLRELCERDETPRIRVADFGIAKLSGTLGEGLTRVGAFIGTPEFAAPEQLVGGTPAPSTDLYAAGAIFYFLLAGRPPFPEEQRHDLVAAYEALLSTLPPKLERTGSASWAAAQDILDALLAPETENRADLHGLFRLLDALETTPDDATASGSTTRGGGEFMTLLPAADGTWADPAADPPPEGSTWTGGDDAATVVEEILASRRMTAIHGAEGGPPPSATPPPQLEAPRGANRGGVPSATPPPEPESALPLVEATPTASGPRYPSPAPQAVGTAPIGAAPRPGTPGVGKDDEDEDDDLETPLTLDDLLGGPRTPRTPRARPTSADVTGVDHENPFETRPSASPARPRATPVAPPPLSSRKPEPRVTVASSSAPAPRLPGLPGATGSVPDTLPLDANGRLALLAAVPEPDARALHAAWGSPDDVRGFVQASLAYRAGGAVEVAVGLCRWAALAGRADWTSRLRNWVVDPSPLVRAAACDALGAVGQVQALTALTPAAGDGDPEVRVACVTALARVAMRGLRPDLARPHVHRLVGDPDPSVRAAAEAAARLLES